MWPRGVIAGEGHAGVEVTWITPFADANYTPTCSLETGVASLNSLRIHHIETITELT